MATISATYCQIWAPFILTSGHTEFMGKPEFERTRRGRVL